MNMLTKLKIFNGWIKYLLIRLNKLKIFND